MAERRSLTGGAGAPAPVSPLPRVSRAVLRTVEPGTDAACARCGQPVKFVARRSAQQVIANVYAAGRWDREEHFPADCYADAGAPHGPADASAPLRRRAG
jgi:hypothetical protein